MLINATIRDEYQEIISGNLRKYAPFAGAAFRNAFGDDHSEADWMAKELGRQTSARVTLIALDGTVLGDSEKDPAQMVNHYDRPEIQEAYAGRIGESTRYSTTLEERMTYVAVPVLEDGEVKGVVRISLKTQAVKLLVTMITRRIILFSIVFWLVALIVTLLFSKIFSSSVRQLVDLTKRLAKGDFTKRATIRSQDELGELGSGLNDMSRRLQSLFSQLQTQHDELNAIIGSMNEGVLVLDSQLRVILANNSLRQMFGIKGDVEKRSYIEVIRSVDIEKMLRELPVSGRVEHRRIELDDRIIMGNGVALDGAEEEAGSYVLVFHDITADAQLENIKAEFAANASHELRTPLTAIKGYLETFEEEDSETQKSFIQIIRRNVDRISNLVSDLMLISRLEAPEPRFSIEKVDLPSIAEDVMKLVERLAQGKDMELKVDIPSGIAINGDSFLLEQMLLNLLDNAVKYTESGAVTLRIRQTGECVIVQVLDTGAGMSREHLPRIFERFYRIDKARSRQLGGTGLGLSIVKHIVQLHNGDIQVESHPGSGTVFTVHLPAS
jgi:two-component system phosphate regulon sensor histidine kinase PhoR